MSANDKSLNIFHKLVTKEDDYTQLLFNLMSRSCEFRQHLLKLMFKDQLPGEVAIGPENIRTQVDLGPDGRPDAVIRTVGLLALIEVKIGLNRGPTPRQVCSATEPNGYARHLDRKASYAERWLIYLVPSGWDCENDVRESLEKIETNGVKTNIVYWEQVAPLLEDSDIFQSEFRALIGGKFMPISFIDDEIAATGLRDFPAAFRATRKLQLLIDKIGEKYGTKKQLGEFDRGSANEYGFYFKVGGRYLLWFGMWGVPGDQYRMRLGKTPPELWFGVSREWENARLTSIFRGEFPEGSRIEVDEWTVGWIPAELLRKSNPVDEVWHQLSSVLPRLQKGIKRASLA